MKVLVTGGAGLLGMNLTQRFRRVGLHVTSTWHNKEPMFRYSNVAYEQTDLTDFKNCLDLTEKQDYVIMSAAVIGGAKAMFNKEWDMVTPNNLIQMNLLRACYENGVKKAVFFGSSTEYPDADHPMKEDEAFIGDPYEKYYPIGWYKRYGETLCRWYNSLGLNVVVLRPSNIYGEYDNFDPEHSHVTAALIRKVVERQNPLVVWGDGSEKRDLIYVGDMVDAVLWALEKVDGYQPLNIGAGYSVSINDILLTLLDFDKGYTPVIEYDKTQPTMIPARYLDTGMAGRLGFEPKTALREGLRKTLEWYKDNA